MAYYLLQVAYTPEAWGAMVREPQDRVEKVRPAAQALGGDIEAAWLAFGEYDLVAVFQMPDNVSMAAASMAFSAGGAVKALKTTPLMTIAEGMEAMGKAGGIGYRPPGS